jgi:hypothetical protein
VVGSLAYKALGDRTPPVAPAPENRPS